MKYFSHLNPAALNPNKVFPENIERVEQRIGLSLPQELSHLLTKIGGAVVFDKGARFKPIAMSGRETPNGHRSLNLLYGLTNDEHGLVNNCGIEQDQFPSHLLAIGETPGGDQICLDRYSPKVLLWKHDFPEGEAITEIAPDFTDFIARLEPDEELQEPEKKSLADLGIIEEESHLDF